jgi:hypothetical protein
MRYGTFLSLQHSLLDHTALCSSKVDRNTIFNFQLPKGKKNKEPDVSLYISLCIYLYIQYIFIHLYILYIYIYLVQIYMSYNI